MARIAVISDVHADVHALQDALSEIDRLDCDRIVCAGDILHYGLFPEETVALLRERRIPCVRGNHDRWAVGDASTVDTTGRSLSEATVAFLEALPAKLWLAVDGVRILVVHARPGSDMDGIYPDEPSSTLLDRWCDDQGADVIIVGHTHMPLVRKTWKGRVVINAGTLMREPKDAVEPPMLLDRASGKFVRVEPVLGTFGVFDTETREFAIREAGNDELPTQQ